MWAPPRLGGLRQPKAQEIQPSNPTFRRSQRPEIQEIYKGLGNGFRKRSGLYKIDNLSAFVSFPPFRRFQRPEIHRGLGNGLHKRSGLYKIDNFWAFVRIPSFQRSQRPEIHEIQKGFGNGFRKKSGLYKIDNFWAFVRFFPFQRSEGPDNKIDNFGAFVRFPPFRRSQTPEIQEIDKGFGNGFRKRSGLYKIDNFWAFVKFPSISAVPKAAQGGLYKIDNFWAFVKFPPFRRSQRPEISPPIELEISAPAACIFHHATCRHFQRCEPTDITGRNLPMMPTPLSLDAHQCVLVARAWRVENAKRRQALTVSWLTPPRSSCDICQPKWRTSWGRTTPLHLSSDVC